MDYKLIGSPCGQHGPYTFYKAMKYTKDGKTSILSLCEFFFVKLWTDSDLISIGELQLLWEDKNSEQTLASLRLYILPENTPDGRTDIHGEDEVLAITEKVVIRVEDLLTWMTEATDWHWGVCAVWSGGPGPVSSASLGPPHSFTLDMEDINREKEALESSHWENHGGVVVLSYPRYCRYRGLIKRLQGVEDVWMRSALITALGGFTCPWKNTRILFCKETFDYPELEGHELLCNHLAPKLKGRPRKRKRHTLSPTEESGTESESSQSTSSSSASKAKLTPKTTTTVKPRLRCTLEVGRRPVRGGGGSGNGGPTSEERNFITALHLFMKDRKTPIGKIPIVGFKEVNLFRLYKKVTELGGYDLVTAGKLWKYVYEVMGGDMSSTSAATLSRRHYEKLLLPYERHLNGSQRTPQKAKPVAVLPVASHHNHQQQQTDAGSKESNKEGSSTLRSNRATANNNNKDEKTLGSGKENIPATTKKEISNNNKQTSPSGGGGGNKQQQTIKAADSPQQQLTVATDSGVSESRETATTKASQQHEGKVVVEGIKRQPIVASMTIPALSPLMKKQKLEILKEGGLEVTPVVPPGGAGGGGGATAQPPPTAGGGHSSPPPPATLLTAASSSSGPAPAPPPPTAANSLPASTTLHSHLSRHLPSSSSPAAAPTSAAPTFRNKVSITVTPDMSHLLSPGPSSSKRPVYGNPKLFTPPPPSLTGEILDLRTNKPRGINIGSNLEITLVPQSKPHYSAQVRSAGPPQTSSSRPHHASSGGPSLSHSRHASAGASSGQQRSRSKNSTTATPVAPQSLPYPPNLYKPPPQHHLSYVPMLDQRSVYLSALYNNMYRPFGPHSAGSLPAVAANVYKELLRRQGIFPSLDGSTSITLVGQTPTSK